MGEAFNCLLKMLLGLLIVIAMMIVAFAMYVYGMRIEIHWG